MHSYRKCAEPGCERHFIPKSSRNRFCLQHRKTKPRDPAHYRKYGPAHRRLRAQVARRVALGDVTCVRCGESIDPREPWDLGHVDGTLGYAGAEHARCNRATKSHRVGRDEWLDPTSRIW
jgi:hypothetical protein